MASPAVATGGALATAARAVVRAARAVRWYVDGVTGESRYAAYVAHTRRTHPDAAPLSERAFWARVHREAGTNPQGRCC